jgi:hypothetical protein
MRLRKFDNYARIIQKAMKRFCAVRVYQKQREQGIYFLVIFDCHFGLYSNSYGYFLWEKRT